MNTNKMKVTKQQIIKIHTLLPIEVKEDKELKKSIIAQYTGSINLTSTADLTFKQANELIDLLKPKKNNSFSADADIKRKRIIYYAHKMNWQNEDNKVDIDRINDWCIKYGYLHKPFMKYTNKELTALVQQFHKVYLAFLKSI